MTTERRRGRRPQIPDAEADNVRVLVERGLRDEKIATKYDVSEATVRGFRKKHGIPSARQARLKRLTREGIRCEQHK